MKILTFGSLLRFYFPLVVISFSQAFTYPLVASVVSGGAQGGREYEAYVIGQQVVTFLASTSFGLVTTGIVFSDSRTSLRNFARLCLSLAAVSALLQLFAGLPFMEEPLFGRLLAVDDAGLRHTARLSLLACIPVQFNFFVRNGYAASLFRARRSDLANIATLTRFAITIPTVWLFVRLGFVGYLAGTVAMTLPSLVETAMCGHFARPYRKTLPDKAPDTSPPASLARQFRFTMPLSLGSILLMATSFIATYFYSFSSDPDRFRLIHFVTYGLAVVFFSAAAMLQTVTVVFAKTRTATRRVLVFSALASLLLGSVLLVLSRIRPFARWYFCEFQKIPEESLALATSALVAGTAVTVLCALRGFVEGMAAVRLRPRAVLVGQMAYAMAFAWAFAECPRLLSGRDHLWGMGAIAFATLISAAATVSATFVTTVPGGEGHRRELAE